MPTESELKHLVKVGERQPSRYLEPAPNSGLHLLYADVKRKPVMPGDQIVETAEPDRLDIFVAGDRSATTMAAASAIAELRDVRAPAGTPVWSLIFVDVKAAARGKKAYQILPGFPVVHAPANPK